jgi:hypothetical protein
MPLEFKYKEFPSQSGDTLYSPVLRVQIARSLPNAQRTKRFEAIVDSGASRCIFHADFAQFLGIDLNACPMEEIVGIGGEEATYLHELALYIPGGQVTIQAAFKENLPVAGLLGMNGFFEHFRVTFDGGDQCFMLDRLYKA